MSVYYYEAGRKELIGKKVCVTNRNKPWEVFSGILVGYAGQKAKIEHSCGGITMHKCRPAWFKLTWEPQVGMSVMGVARRHEPEYINDINYGYWNGVIEEIKDDRAVIRMVSDGRVSTRWIKNIRPRP